MSDDARCAYAMCRNVATWQIGFENDLVTAPSVPYCDGHIEIVKRAFSTKNLERIKRGGKKNGTRRST